MSSSSDEEREEAIITAIAAGKSIRSIAREHELSEAEVRAIKKEAIDRAYDGEWLREDWAMENYRLRAIGLKYFGHAMTEEGDNAAAMIYIKASERRATLGGANAPQAYSVHLRNDAAPPALTSTDYYANLLDEFIGQKRPQEEPSPSEEEPSGPQPGQRLEVLKG